MLPACHYLPSLTLSSAVSCSETPLSASSDDIFEIHVVFRSSSMQYIQCFRDHITDCWITVFCNKNWDCLCLHIWASVSENSVFVTSERYRPTTCYCFGVESFEWLETCSTSFIINCCLYVQKCTGFSSAFRWNGQKHFELVSLILAHQDTVTELEQGRVDVGLCFYAFTSS